MALQFEDFGSEDDYEQILLKAILSRFRARADAGVMAEIYCVCSAIFQSCGNNLGPMIVDRGWLAYTASIGMALCEVPNAPHATPKDLADVESAARRALCGMTRTLYEALAEGRVDERSGEMYYHSFLIPPEFVQKFEQQNKGSSRLI